MCTSIWGAAEHRNHHPVVLVEEDSLPVEAGVHLAVEGTLETAVHILVAAVAEGMEIAPVGAGRRHHLEHHLEHRTVLVGGHHIVLEGALRTALGEVHRTDSVGVRRIVAHQRDGYLARLSCRKMNQWRREVILPTMKH